MASADDNTSRMNVSLPESLRAFVQQQVGEGHRYPSASEFICALLREAKAKDGGRHLDARLVEGFGSPDDDTVREAIAGIRRLRAGRTLKGVSIRDLIDEGRP